MYYNAHRKNELVISTMLIVIIVAGNLEWIFKLLFFCVLVNCRLLLDLKHAIIFIDTYGRFQM